MTHLAVALLAFAASPLAAQSSGIIQGTITDSASQRPLANVQVGVLGTALGTRSGEDGRFTIANVPAGSQTVRITRIGFRPVNREVTVSAGGTATISVSLVATATTLEGVVVTALGIEREERSISTSVQTVSSEDLTRAPDAQNLVSSLSGKVAGVQITTGNSAGGAARIVIRGTNSLTGSNQPLFVVDGIPVSNAAATSGTRGYNAIDYGNLMADLNPNDIESISVLKGPNAAALYGSRAANGAIIITTKSGSVAGTTQITASSNVTFETPLRLPKYQNLYGQGFNGQYAYVDGRGGGTNDDTDESWGPRLDGSLIPQFDSPVDPVTGERTPTPWVAHPNNVRDFFETGRTSTLNASFATTGERTNVRLSLGRMDQKGMIPGFGMQRSNVSLHGGADLSDRLRTDASLQYINSGARNRPAQGYGGANPMWQFLWFGRQVDTRVLQSRIHNPDGSLFNWNNRWSNNPYFTAHENLNQDQRDRVIGNASLSYDFTDWISGTVRAGTDWSQSHRRQHFAEGNLSVSSVDRNGALGADDAFRQETNVDFLLNARVPTTGDFGVEVDAGGSRRDNRYRGSSVYIRNLAIPGVYSFSNYVEPPIPSDWREARAVNSLYAQARFSWRDLAFVDVSGRNDWSSTLPDGNNSYFYPAASASLVFSDLVNVPALSFGRIRAGWATVGNDAAPYQLIDPYGFDLPFGTAPRLTASNTLRNPNLKPEKTTSWEFGTDLRFLGDRLGIGATYYDKQTTNQIVPLSVSAMTGFTQRYVNAGKISNNGVELMVDATPIRLANGLQWNVSANWSADRAWVDELYEDMETMVLDTYYSVTFEARKGQRYGALYGRKYVRDGEGNIVVGTNGLPLNSAGTNPVDYLGNANPDWIAGLTNSISYKGLQLSGVVDIRKGGTIYSLTNYYGRRSGVLIESLEGRRESIDEGLIVPGVKVVGNDTLPNDIRVSAQSYHRNLGGISEAFTFDASYIKLRELSLSYDVPSSLTNRWGVNALRVALIGRNLWLKTDVPHIDPETAFNSGNVQGFEYSQMPTARSIGFNITVTP